jgi:mono/diheme cytochrome c family protein
MRTHSRLLRGDSIIFAASIAVVMVTILSVSPQMANAQAAQDQVTFTKEVSRILQDNCQVCHRPGTFAPMSLVTFEETRPWARSIKAKVVGREMPPWFVDRTIGIQRYSNDVSLSEEEIATISKWVDNGAPMGNPSDMPPPKQFDDGETWHIGQPDFTLALPKDLVVPASGPDKWLNILVDTKLPEDRYIKGVQIMTTKGHEVFHHIITNMRPPATDDDDGAGDQGGAFLNEYALGKAGDVFPEDSGRLIKANSRINFNIHLHSNGKETLGNVLLGLTFHPKGYVPKKEVTSLRVGNLTEVDIPPNTDNVRTDAYQTLTRPARVLSFQPHMHNRGKYACLEAIYPNSRTEMLSCAQFNFAWHLNYVFDDDEAPLLPAGTVLHAINYHDNTAANKANPDPDAMITWGQRTVDEMTNPWVSYYYMSDEDFKKETEARAAKLRATAGTRD